MCNHRLASFRDKKTLKPRLSSSDIAIQNSESIIRKLSRAEFTIGWHQRALCWHTWLANLITITKTLALGLHSPISLSHKPRTEDVIKTETKNRKMEGTDLHRESLTLLQSTGKCWNHTVGTPDRWSQIQQMSSPEGSNHLSNLRQDLLHSENKKGNSLTRNWLMLQLWRPPLRNQKMQSYLYFQNS